MATVATGTPLGICTVASSASIPPSVPEGAAIGSPITGSVVCAASTPARCAAPPAAATIAFTPRPRASLARAIARSGVRCAEATCISYGMPKDASASAAGFTTGRSESLPITIRTSPFASFAIQAPFDVPYSKIALTDSPV